LINSISPQQTYGTLSLGGNIGFNESILNKASFQYHFRMLQEPILCKANGNNVMESAVKQIIVDYVRKFQE
jgi:hypothetical protein